MSANCFDFSGTSSPRPLTGASLLTPLGDFWGLPSPRTPGQYIHQMNIPGPANDLKGEQHRWEFGKHCMLENYFNGIGYWKVETV